MLRVLRSRSRCCCLKNIGNPDGYIVKILAGDEIHLYEVPVLRVV